VSIYATLWRLKFPEDGDDYFGCDWIEVVAQGVPAHIGSPMPGCGYEDGDPYGEFLPPALETDEDGEHKYMRAVVIVIAGTPKGTTRSAQEYTTPLLVLTGEEYASISFEALYERICEALRGGRPRVVAQYFTPDGHIELIHEREVPSKDEE
jgi:hypothetical protein